MKFSSYFTASILLAVPSTSSALDIDLTPASGMSQQAINGFRAAADFWEDALSDDVTVNVNIGFSVLAPRVLASAGSTQEIISIANYFTALRSDGTSDLDTTVISNLPGLSLFFGGLSFRTQIFDSVTATMLLGTDNNDSHNNRFLFLNTSTAKAIGLFTGVASASDANITFNSTFTWDFDNTDGIDAGKRDFVGVAIHELGHSLGFKSGVDVIDDAISNPRDLQRFALWSGLDMFRYSAAGVNDLSAGTASYFSVDGGVTNLGAFSTGKVNGDLAQASHWKDNLGLGIMDPTFSLGQTNTVTSLDLQAFDAMGWNLALSAVPEPAIGGFLLASAVVLLGHRSRKS